MATGVTINQQKSQPYRSQPSACQPHPAQQQTRPSLATNSIMQEQQVANNTSLISDKNGNATCDACYKRKSRCAMNESVNKCYSCDFHRQECTFTLSSQLGKRKLGETGLEPDPVGRYPRNNLISSGREVPGHSQDSTKNNTSDCAVMTAQYIGMTTELEPLLLDYLPLDQNGEGQLAASRIRKFSRDGTYMRMINGPQAGPELPPVTAETIENLVTPFGPSLIEKFFQHIHPSFPILLEDKFRSLYQSRSAPPVLVAAIYLVSLKWVDPGPGIQTLRNPDAARLEATALKLVNESFVQPQLATIQAGLLLSQKSTLFSPRLMAQLVAAAFEMGLHQDCSSWSMENWEKGLRKRLAWALYVQDKWCALTQGQPSHIFAQNWTVQELSPHDFEGCYSKGPSSEEPPAYGAGPLLFSRFITLTTILSDILDTFYSLRASQDFTHAGQESTRIILDRAKPIQLRLKNWFAHLPPELKMDSSLNPIDTITSTGANTAANGGLHLAYFATEITLHRCIIRSLRPNSTDDYLAHICRSAAKTRLISAMDFVNRLRPNHLRAFWPAASRTNFALIVAFGMLLRITAQTREEEEFYRLRLGEYRWTLEVSRRHATFLGWVVECLDVMGSVVRNVGSKKPALEEYVAKSNPPAARAPTVRWADLRESDTGEDDKDTTSSATRRCNQSVASSSSGAGVSTLVSPDTSVSGGSRRGSRSGRQAEQRNGMNVADLT